MERHSGLSDLPQLKATASNYRGRRLMLDSRTGELQPFIVQDNPNPFSPDCLFLSWRLPLFCIHEYSLEVLLWELGALRLNSLRLREKLGL